MNNIEKNTQISAIGGKISIQLEDKYYKTGGKFSLFNPDGTFFRIPFL